MVASEMKQKTCCFTGHRNIPVEEEFVVFERLDRYIKALIKKGVKYFGVGGAIGFDTLAAQHLLFLRDVERLDIKVILVCPFMGFTDRWSEKQKQCFDSMLHKFDKVIYKEETPSRAAYLSRNRHLVDGSAYCIAYCTRDYGGTAYTVRYAMKNGITVLNTADYAVDTFCLI